MSEQIEVIEVAEQVEAAEQVKSTTVEAKNKEHREITKSHKAPYLSHWPLVIATHLVELLPGVSKILFLNAGLAELRKREYEESQTCMPHPLPKEKFGINELTTPVVGLEILKKTTEQESVGYLSALHFREAYLSGKTTPLQVAEKLIQKIRTSNTTTNGNPALNGICQINEEDVLRQARESTSRYAENRSSGVLDGVPVAIKDEYDVEGYETRLGTNFLNKGNKAKRDAKLVNRLRNQGALIIGKTSMHEWGADITGNNPKVATSRNPYNTNHYCGGSSGGSGCVVAAGLCPIAVGNDAAGSIRVPASFCGVYGLKTTVGRISPIGELYSGWTVGVAGPLATSVDDLALAYYIMAGKDEADSFTHHQPPPTLDGLYSTSTLSDLKIGIFSDWNRQVQDPAITTAIQEFIDAIKLRGAEVVEIEIPELEEARVAHLVTVAAEFFNAFFGCKDKKKSSYPNRIQFQVFKHFTAADYIKAEQVRTRSMEHTANAFSNVHLILTPATGITAPKIRPLSLKYGEIDANATADAIRFSSLGNFTGIPSVTVPAGYNANGLPIGLQFMAKWYDEAILLRIAKVCEEVLGSKRRVPKDGQWFGGGLL